MPIYGYDDVVGWLHVPACFRYFQLAFYKNKLGFAKFQLVFQKSKLAFVKFQLVFGKMKLAFRKF